MADVLSNYEFPRRGRAKYPWEKWLDGQVWRLRRPADFQCKPSAFFGAANEHRKRNGLEGVIHRSIEDENTLVLQFRATAAKKSNGNGNGDARHLVGAIPRLNPSDYE